MSRHANISIFVPHLGCPVHCSFCNQCTITCQLKNATVQDINRAVAECMQSKSYDPQNTEIAFFGGSFTAIDRTLMMQLLECAFEHVKSGNVCGIRLSTRPDAIDCEILDILKSNGVTAIELGAQSMDDGVLLANRRGHTADSVRNAARLIKQYGFELGLQMMTGLYTDTDEKSIHTAKELIALKPDCVRIYPTIVLKGTQLEKLVQSGEYKPQELYSAVNLAARLVLMFEQENITVIRVGLHTLESDSFVAGPWHAAFGELCEGEIFKNLLLQRMENKGNYTVYCAKSAVSKVVGHKQKNIEILRGLGYNYKVICDPNLTGRQLRVKEGF